MVHITITHCPAHRHIDPSHISTICKECEFHIDKFISTLSTFVSFRNMTISRCPQKLFVIAEEQQSAMNGKMILYCEPCG